eukprot:TRINITY_DN818_c0_g1_i1.p5 TRINITY_DN818_c0_g1~~TRINITY_DN818_c0_g1_i1.p5  ORF type:complete len:448 (+),score=87.75 TRINITY_DN818_c0_g1_i1:797-2140(+)
MEPINEVDDESLEVEELLENDDKEQYERFREQEKEAYVQKSLAVIEEQQRKREESKETKFMREQEEFYEGISGIALRSGRFITSAELKQMVEGKKYVNIDSVEQVINPESRSSSSCYTIGILCATSKVKKSKANISFLTWIFSSLKKTDAKPSEVSSMRVKHGYKTLAVFIYGEVARSFAGTEAGGVYAIINPAPMPKTTDHEYALRVTQKSQLVKIGKSLDFDYCKHLSKVNGTQCRNFVNSAIERYCEFHAHKKADQIKAKRPGLQSTYLDLNQVRKEQEEKYGQLLIGKPFKKLLEKKNEEPEMTKEAKEKLNKWQKEETNRLAAFIKKRSDPVKAVNQLHKILAGTEQPKADAKPQEEEDVLELEIEMDNTGNDDKLIKSIMEKKKKQTFEEKFSKEAAVQQNPKRFKSEQQQAYNTLKFIKQYKEYRTSYILLVLLLTAVQS